jgi:hypothetical protein
MNTYNVRLSDGTGVLVSAANWLQALAIVALYLARSGSEATVIGFRTDYTAALN